MCIQVTQEAKTPQTARAMEAQFQQRFANRSDLHEADMPVECLLAGLAHLSIPTLVVAESAGLSRLSDSLSCSISRKSFPELPGQAMGSSPHGSAFQAGTNTHCVGAN